MWFRVDDKFYDHPKVRKLGKSRLAAIGLWALAGSWAADNGTDGFIPAEVVKRYDERHRNAARLVAQNLWELGERNGEVGYFFHQWTNWQPTARHLETKREANRERVRRWRERKTADQEVSTEEGNGVRNALRNALRNGPVTPPPIPIKELTHLGSETCVGEGGSGGEALAPEPPPEPHPPEVAKSAPRQRGALAKPKTGTNRGTRIPNDFAVTSEMVTWAREHVPHVDGRRETAKFIDYWQAKSGKDATKKDWVAAWRYWMRGAEDRRPNKNTRPTADTKLAGWEAMKEQPTLWSPAITTGEQNHAIGHDTIVPE